MFDFDILDSKTLLGESSFYLHKTNEIVFLDLLNPSILFYSIKNKKREKIITSIIGFGSGILGGLSTVYGPPMLAYLVAVNLPKEKFVRTVSTMYFIGSFPLYGSLIYYGFAKKEDLILSVLLIIPALIAQQFGTKIGSYQGLQHRAAKLFCEIELSKSVVIKALQVIDQKNENFSYYAHLAKAKLGEVLKLTSNEAIQMHGGIGVTDEYDIGFFLKRARVAEQIFGSAKFHTERYANLSGF